MLIASPRTPEPPRRLGGLAVGCLALRFEVGHCKVQHRGVMMGQPRDNRGRAGGAEASDVATILDSINDGVFTVDGEFRVTSFNRAAEAITGVSRDAAIGRSCCEVFRADICEGECALKQTIATGKPVVNKSIVILNSANTRVPISVSTALLAGRDGAIVGGVETFRDLTLVEELRREVERRFASHDIVTSSPSMREMLALLPAVADSDATVLITGASGTGKELVARAIHSLSPRAGKPLVTVNCGALPDPLLESELFGYVAGAFTGARGDKPGRLAAAQGGTLFLDEIGDISPALQVRLLRALQERTYEPLGSNRTVHADIRFVAATHADLRAEVAAGRFRADLFYRLQVVQIAIPPLCERREDIPLLAAHFILRFNRLRGREIEGLAPEAMDHLLRHDWPGNVRELETAIEHAFVLCRHALIQPSHLPPSVVSSHPIHGAPPRPRGRLRDLEHAEILAALERNGGQRAATARELGIHPTTLWRKLRRFES
jgi:PAS domain S-box-containing protein